MLLALFTYHTPITMATQTNHTGNQTEETSANEPTQKGNVANTSSASRTLEQSFKERTEERDHALDAVEHLAEYASELREALEDISEEDGLTAKFAAHVLDSEELPEELDQLVEDC